MSSLRTRKILNRHFFSLFVVFSKGSKGRFSFWFCVQLQRSTRHAVHVCVGAWTLGLVQPRIKVLDNLDI